MRAPIFARARFTVRKKDCLRLRAMGSVAEVAGYPPKSALAMGAIGDVVAPRVVAQNRQGIPLVQPLSVQAGNQQPLDLGQSQRWGFF